MKIKTPEGLAAPAEYCRSVENAIRLIRSPHAIKCWILDLRAYGRSRGWDLTAINKVLAPLESRIQEWHPKLPELPPGRQRRAHVRTDPEPAAEELASESLARSVDTAFSEILSRYARLADENTDKQLYHANCLKTLLKAREDWNLWKKSLGLPVRFIK